MHPGIIFFFNSLVLVLLSYAAYTDYKTRTIPKKLIFFITLLLIVPILNNKITVAHLIFIIAVLLLRFKFPNGFGGADVLLSVPLSLSFPAWLLMFFIWVVLLINLIYYILNFKKPAPLFVSMFLTYSGIVLVFYIDNI